MCSYCVLPSSSCTLTHMATPVQYICMSCYTHSYLCVTHALFLCLLSFIRCRVLCNSPPPGQVVNISSDVQTHTHTVNDKYTSTHSTLTEMHAHIYTHMQRPYCISFISCTPLSICSRTGVRSEEGDFVLAASQSCSPLIHTVMCHRRILTVL